MKFKDHFSFENKISRSQFWGTILIGLAAFLSIFFLGLLLVGMGAVNAPLFLFGMIVFLGSIVGYIWLQLAATVKRCRDADINPFWTAATFIPYVGWIIFIIIGVLPTVEKKAELA